MLQETDRRKVRVYRKFNSVFLSLQEVLVVALAICMCVVKVLLPFSEALMPVGVLFVATKGMDDVLEKVKGYADNAHGTQTRKYSAERYIVHPERVMKMCRQYTDKLPVLAAALLHDVLEDTPVTNAALYRFLQSVMEEEDAKETLHLVVELSDVYTKAAHPRWNRRKRKMKESARIQKTSPDSQTVKYADIIDNCREIVQHDPDFAKVFLRECKELLKVIPEGNETLYSEAKETVNRCLQQVLNP